MMKILLLDPQRIYKDKLRDLNCIEEEISFHVDERSGSLPSDDSAIDVIVGAGDLSQRTKLIDPLLAWRTHPHTYLIPCWIPADIKAFTNVCLWPRLAIDRFDEQFNVRSLCSWTNEITEWQQKRSFFPNSGTFKDRTILEVITSLALRNATGRLSVFGEQEREGILSFYEGFLSDAVIRESRLKGEEAFYELFSWTEGNYLWEPLSFSTPAPRIVSIRSLIIQGLELLREGNLLFHFLPKLDCFLEKTDSQSALDDKADPFFAAQQEIYHLVDGNYSAVEIIKDSPLSRPRTMSLLAKFFSLGDITTASHDRSEAVHRLLIVDDSRLMCRAIEEIFSQDPRFEIIGFAYDGVEALKLVREQQPDVLTMDIQMPRMDGLTALKHIMIRNPKPVVILSAFTKETSRLTYEAFKYGAVDVITKPSRDSAQKMAEEAKRLRDRVAQASVVRLGAAQYIRGQKKIQSTEEQKPFDVSTAQSDPDLNRRVILIACGSGGFSSLMKLFFSLSGLEPLPPLITCMAMPKSVVEALIPNLAKDCQVRIEFLSEQTRLTPGICYFYSHNQCFWLSREEDEIWLKSGSREHEVYGPLDFLLLSGAKSFGDKAVALLISGDGTDGLRGMRYLQQSGGRIFTLSPEVCLKPDLPRKILEQGLAREVKTISEMAQLIENPSAIGCTGSCTDSSADFPERQDKE